MIKFKGWLMKENTLIEVFFTENGLAYQINEKYLVSYIQLYGLQPIISSLENIAKEIIEKGENEEAIKQVFDGMVNEITKGF